jgi:hypothetical protein
VTHALRDVKQRRGVGCLMHSGCRSPAFPSRPLSLVEEHTTNRSAFLGALILLLRRALA